MEQSLDCFGTYPANEEKCRECSYFSSCRYYRATEPAVHSHSGFPSYERVAGWLLQAVDYDHIPGNEEPEEVSRKTVSKYPGADLAALGEVLRFLLALDDYTMGILAEVIVPDRDNPAGGRTVSELARLHRCTRQAMHRKTLAAVRKHPELAGVMQLTLRKISKCRRSFAAGEALHRAGR